MLPWSDATKAASREKLKVIIKKQVETMTTTTWALCLSRLWLYVYKSRDRAHWNSNYKQEYIQRNWIQWKKERTRSNSVHNKLSHQKQSFLGIYLKKREHFQPLKQPQSDSIQQQLIQENSAWAETLSGTPAPTPGFTSHLLLLC